MYFLFDINNHPSLLYSLINLILDYNNETLLALSFSMKLLNENGYEKYYAEYFNLENPISFNIKLDDYYDKPSHAHDFIKIEKFILEKFGLDIKNDPEKMDLKINLLLDLDFLKVTAKKRGLSTEQYRLLLLMVPQEKIFFDNAKVYYNENFREANFAVLKKIYDNFESDK